MSVDRELLEAQLRQIAASAKATQAAAEALLRQLQGEEDEGSGAAELGSGAAQNDADEAAARLVSMKLALDGVPRDEAAKKITEDFGIANPKPLIEDVYKRAGASPA